MDSELNVTYITLGGYVEVDKYRYLYFVIMLTAYILILCFNCTIVCLIWMHKNLHEPMYIFIAALLINSVLFSTSFYPKLLSDFLSEKQVITYSTCLFQFFMFYSLGGSEFMLLAVMAYDRYVSICKPLRYSSIMRKRTVTVLLALAWLVPACEVLIQLIPYASKNICNFTFKGIICNSTIGRLHCVQSNVHNIYGLVVFVNIMILPVLFVLFTYIRLFIVAYHSSREVKRKATQTCLPHLIVLISFSCLGAYDVLLLRMETDFPKIIRFVMSLQIVIYHPLFNPIIYGLKMKEIYKHLRRLFVRTVYVLPIDSWVKL
ncbi:olfactory receptor 10K1-like [Parambassis ranga]|uniref:Olfactory receptor n=1 Tax=Parambassis ranga TaxID=210632 RepID=A0A6P7HIF5_9TELE|nr:olfactory receptor 10K1-like [Parambassis ranga]